jgi:hypothetical protein
VCAYSLLRKGFSCTWLTPPSILSSQCKAYSSRHRVSIMRKLSSSFSETAGYLRGMIWSGAQAAMMLCLTQVMLDRIMSL